MKGMVGNGAPVSDAQWQQLTAAARQVCANAHVPYSGFRVGAAVLTRDGVIARGCNVENASFGLTICAERNAIFRAIGDGARSIVALVIYTPTDVPVMPCGACRQVLAEFGPEVVIRSGCDGPSRIEHTLAELLPHAFALKSD